MTTFTTDFSTDTAGAAPVGWTTLASYTWAGTVVADAGATGGKVLRGTATAQTCLVLDQWYGKSTVDLTVRLRKRGDGSQTESGLWFRGQIVSLRSSSLFLYQKLGTSQGADLGLVSPTFNYAVDTWYKMRLQADAAGFRAKVWADSDAEPSAWQIEKKGNVGNEDLGIGLYHYTYGPGGSGSTNYTEFDTASFTEYPVKDFSDEVTGTLSAGAPYGWTRSSTSESWSIVDVVGAAGGKVLRSPTAAGPRTLRHDLSNSRNDLDITIKMRTSIATASGNSGGPGLWLGETKNGVRIRLTGSDISILGMNVSTVSTTSTFAFTWTLNEWVYIRAKKLFGTLYVKAWRAVDPEPGSWGYTGSLSGWASDSYDKTPFYSGLLTDAAGTHDFDTVQITYPEATTDFSSDATGANPPALFTKHANYGPNVPWTVNDPGGGNKFLRNVYNSDSVFNRMLVFEPATNVNDLDITTRIRASGTTMPEIRLGAYRAGADAWPDSTTVTFGSSPQKLLRVQNQRASSLAFNDTVNYAWTANTWLNVRVQKVGTTIKVRVWADGAAEPSTWLYTKTHNNIFETRTPFVNGISAATGGSDTQDFDNFGFTQSTDPNASITLGAPSANVAQGLTPTLNLTVGISINPPIATATGSGIDPTVNAVIRQDISVDLSAVPLPGATFIAIDAIAGIGPSIPVPVGTASGSAYVATIAPVEYCYTDFSNYPTNALPSDWTNHSDANASAKVQALTGATGGKVLRLTGASGQPFTATASWNLTNSLPAVSVLARWKVTVGFDGNIGISLNRQANGDRYDMTVNDNNQFGIAVNGFVFTVMHPNLGSLLGQWVWIRGEFKDGKLSTKVWLDGSPEPGWMLSDEIPSVVLGAGPASAYAFSYAGSPPSVVDFDTFEVTQSLQSVQTSINLRYQVLPLIQKNLGLLWKATKVVDKSVGLKWSVAQAPVSVQTSVSLVWTGVQSVKVTSALSWAVAKEVVVSRALRWVFSQEVDQKSRALVWNVRKLVPTSSIDLRWADVHTVDAPTKLELVWQDQLAVVQKLTTRWVTQSEGRVTLSRRMPWDTLATLRKDLRTRWSANLDALGALVEDFDTKSTGVLTPGHGLVVLDNRLRSIPEVQPGSPHYTDWSIVEDPFLFGGKALVSRGQAGSQSPGLLYFENEPDPWEHDVVARIRLVASQPGVQNWEESIRRLNDYGKDPVYNTAQESAYTLSNVGNIWRFNYVTMNSGLGQGPVFVQSSSMILTFPDQAWIWTRVQVRRDVGNRLTQAKAKIWADGVPEPKDWMLDFTVGNMAGFPVDRNGNAITTGYTGQYSMFSGNIDVDRVSWTTPSSHVLEDAPAGAAFGFLEPVVALRQTVQAPIFIANASFPEPDIDIGDQVLVSWLVLEIPAPISVVEAIEVDDLGSASYTMLAPTVLAQAFLSIPVPIANPASFSMPAPLVVGHAGVGVAVDNVSLASIAMPNPAVRVVARAVIFTDTALAQVAGLVPTLNTEFNARVDAVPASAAFRMLKVDSINGSREVEADLGVAGASMIPVQGVVATLSIHVDNATLAQAQMLPADARFGVSVPTSRATANASGLVPTVQTSISTVAPLVRASARMSDTALTRTSTRFPVGVTALVLAQMPEPFAQAFFTRVDVHVGGSAAFGLFAAVAPEFLSTPAAIGDALVLELGSTVAVVRLGSTMTDVQLGATLGVVELSDVRDEAKV